MSDIVPIIKPGVYNIVVAEILGHDEDIRAERLTRRHDKVTLLPPGAGPEIDQEWRVIPGRSHEHGSIVIERPESIRPSSYLIYKGAPQKPKEGELIEYRRNQEFPPNEWHPTIAPGFRYILHVTGSNLGIRLAHKSHEGVVLDLGAERQLFWRFLPVNGPQYEADTSS